MIIWICTDMEGLAGVDCWDHCNGGDDSPEYRHGREQLTADVNAAAAGCFDAGATEVRVLDGHGRNRNNGFIAEKLDPRIRKIWAASLNPVRWEGLDETVAAVAMIGQHAMAGTLNAFLDHTQSSRTICRFMINGREHGEMSQCALYAGALGVPLVYASGDHWLCVEAERLFPHVVTTPTKRGTGWATCELYPVDEVRGNIRRDIAHAVTRIDHGKAWRLPTPIHVSVEYGSSAFADVYRDVPNVRRSHARMVDWFIDDPRDIYTWPSKDWTPAARP